MDMKKFLSLAKLLTRGRGKNSVIQLQYSNGFLDLILLNYNQYMYLSWRMPYTTTDTDIPPVFTLDFDVFTKAAKLQKQFVYTKEKINGVLVKETDRMFEEFKTESNYVLLTTVDKMAIYYASLNVSTSALRPALAGIHISENGDVVATDGYRGYLGVQLATMYCGALDNKQSPKICGEICNGLTPETVNIYTTETSCKIVSEEDSVSFYCRWITETYPDYSRIIPKEFSHVLTVRRLDLLNSLTDILPFVNPETKTVYMQFEWGRETVITLTTKDNVLSRTLPFTVKQHPSEMVKSMILNIEHLISALKNGTGHLVSLKFNSAEGCVILQTSTTDCFFLASYRNLSKG